VGPSRLHETLGVVFELVHQRIGVLDDVGKANIHVLKPMDAKTRGYGRKRLHRCSVNIDAIQ
jgi:hypothetical protein